MQKIAETFKPFLAPFGKKTIITSCLLWVGALIFFITYYFWGTLLVSDFYHERSLSFLNELLEGRDSHSLEFCYAKTDRVVYNVISLIFALSLVPYFHIHARNSRSTIEFRIVILMPIAALFWVTAYLIGRFDWQLGVYRVTMLGLVLLAIPLVLRLSRGLTAFAPNAFFVLLMALVIALVCWHCLYFSRAIKIPT